MHTIICHGWKFNLFCLLFCLLKLCRERNSRMKFEANKVRAWHIKLMVVFLSGGLSEEKTTFRVSSIYRGRNNNKNQEYLKAFEIFSWLSNSNFVACYQYCKLLQNVFLPADKQRTLMVCSDENGWAPEKYLSKTHLKWVCDISRLGCGTGTFKSILPVPQIYCIKTLSKVFIHQKLSWKPKESL